MKYILVLNGFPQSGKDSLAQFLKEEMVRLGKIAFIHSTVYSVKRAAKLLGWDGEKNENGRNALAALKDLSTTFFDGPFKEIEKLMKTINDESVLILMVREPNEIKRISENFPQTRTIFIERKDSIRASNHADMEVENHMYDYYIDNNGTLNQLKESAQEVANLTIAEFNYQNIQI